jgi:hypothetical protein
MRHLRIFCAAMTLGVIALACGGGSTGGSLPTSPPATPSVPSNPCDSIRLDPAVSAALPVPDTLPAKRRGPALDRGSRYGVLDALWTHEAARRGGAPQAAGAEHALADVGEVAVIQDNGDIVLPANTFDLTGVGLSFAPNAAGGFDVRRGDVTFQQDLGTRLAVEYRRRVLDPVLRPPARLRLDQLGRQPHLRAIRHREHRARHLAVPCRPAADCGRLRRPRPVGRRCRIRQLEERHLHGDVVRRARV